MYWSFIFQLYPAAFGTVDQFVVYALREVTTAADRASLERMNPIGLSLADGILLIRIMRDKAAALNAAYGGTDWTPCKIDMVPRTMRDK